MAHWNMHPRMALATISKRGFPNVSPFRKRGIKGDFASA